MSKTKSEESCSTDGANKLLAQQQELIRREKVNYFSIKEIEALTGVKAHTIRIWEQRYDMVKPKRTETNIRYYDDKDLRKLLNVALLNRNGFKISEIAGFDEQVLKEQVLKLGSEKSDFENQTQALTLTMLDLDEAGFEKLLSTIFLQMGIEKGMTEIIFPFFRSIGIMWQTGSINPAHEHFITNIIRQKLIVAIDGQSVKYDSYTKRYMLYLPEGEFHELGLLFTNYVIRSRGHQVIYIGANVPYIDLKVVHKTYKPDVMLTTLTSPMVNVSAQKYFDDLYRDFPNTSVLASGMLVLHDDKLVLPPNVRLIKDFNEMIRIVSELN
ncbi:MAG: MerR family transcriptional regulator [Bacteroidia bacterium]|jgi:MerR family transcriptional regulator, light-induced transcriptional regulator